MNNKEPALSETEGPALSEREGPVQNKGRTLNIERILVALDASAHSLTALETAVDLAVRFDADLIGVFVEDVNLLRLADLPFASEVGHFSAARRRLNGQGVELQLRARSMRIRRTFRSITTRAQVRRTFRVARGGVDKELLTAAEEADLIVLGKRGWALPHVRRLGSTARALLEQGPDLTLLLQDGVRLTGPVLLVYDGSAIADKALEAAALLVDGETYAITTLLLAEDENKSQKLRERIRTWLQDRDLEVHCRQLTVSNVDRLIHRIQMEAYGTLVLPARGALVRSEPLITLLHEIEMPILLVR